MVQGDFGLWLLLLEWAESRPSRPRTRRSLRDRLAALHHADGASVALLALVTAMAALLVCLFIGMALGVSCLAGGLAAIAVWVCAGRFVSTPQTSPWRRGLQGLIRKITPFVVGGFLTSLLMSPFDETITTQIACLLGGAIFAFGPTTTSAQSARRSA